MMPFPSNLSIWRASGFSVCSVPQGRPRREPVRHRGIVKGLGLFEGRVSIKQHDLIHIGLESDLLEAYYLIEARRYPTIKASQRNARPRV